MTLTEQEFRIKSDEALEQARRALLPLADEEGFEIEFSERHAQPGVRGAVGGPVRRQPQRAGAADLGVGDGAGLQAVVGAGAGAFALNGETLPQLLDRLTRQFLAG